MFKACSTASFTNDKRFVRSNLFIVLEGGEALVDKKLQDIL